MRKLTLFPAAGLLLGVLLTWSALAPATPYSGILSTTVGGDIEYCTGANCDKCSVMIGPECADEDPWPAICQCTGGITYGYQCYPDTEPSHYCRAHCAWQYCPSNHNEDCR
jgi:hypothetical protein